MRTEPISPAPPPLLVLATLVFLFMLYSREASLQEDLPVFLSVPETPVYLELSGDGLAPGVYQFSDGSTSLPVNSLTGSLRAGDSSATTADTRRFSSGERLKIVKKEQRIDVLPLGWMPASHRMALSIPLHPNRMNEEDWRALPGVGVILAERIERNRQEFGEFDRLEALMRVKGIGKKSIDRWRKFFY